MVDSMDNTDNTFEVLADIDLPALQHTQEYSNIADGPFAVEFSKNELALGAQLNMLPKGMISFLFGSSVKFIPQNTPVAVDTARQTVTFGDKEMAYVIRPLTLADQKYFFPQLSFENLDEFKDYVAQLGMRIIGGTGDLTPQAITSDGDTVLGLFQQTSNGFFRRENKQWVKLDKNNENDWDDVDDKVWTPVLNGAVSIYDKESTSSDSISRSLFNSYIV